MANRARRMGGAGMTMGRLPYHSPSDSFILAPPPNPDPTPWTRPPSATATPAWTSTPATVSWTASSPSPHAPGARACSPAWAAGRAHRPGRLRCPVPDPPGAFPRAGAGLRHRRGGHQTQTGLAAEPPRHHRHRPGGHVRQRHPGGRRRAPVLSRLLRHRPPGPGHRRGGGAGHRSWLRDGRLRPHRRGDGGDARPLRRRGIRPGRLLRRRGGAGRDPRRLAAATPSSASSSR